MKEAESKETLTEVAVERLTADIVNGVLSPDKKLLIADLKERYGMGASPLREGLAQLSSLGFVVFDSRRGFRVTPISKEDLEDVSTVRKVIEITALRQALEHGDDEWEVGIVTAFARLKRIVARLESGEDSDESNFERAHKQMHVALLSACRSRRLLTMQSVLFDQARRYRHLMISQIRDLQEFLKIHDELVQVVISRQTEKACTMFGEHIDLTPQKVYPEFGEVPAGA